MLIQIEIPEDLRAYILDVQLKQKTKNNNSFFSQERTILHILKDHMKQSGFKYEKPHREEDDDSGSE